MKLRGEGMKKFISCDFETTTTEPARVWAAVAVNVADLKVLGVFENIDDFIDYVLSIKGKVTALFHNAKFDASFIVDRLERSGFRSKGKGNGYSVRVDDLGRFYGMKIIRGKNEIEIRDTLKLIPMKVEEMPEAFGMEGIKKGRIDYSKDRPEGYKMNEEERGYVVTDALIVAKAVKSFLDMGLDKATIGGNALEEYKKTIGKSSFFKRFPTVSIECDDFIRNAYRGGWCYVKDDIKGKEIKCDGYVYDVNSLYPSVMVDFPLPVGEPERYEGKYEKDPTHPLFIERIKISFKIKKGKLPFIQAKRVTEGVMGETMKEAKEPIEICVTSVDLDLIKENYDILSLEELGGYKFRERRGMFDEYIKKWYSIKESSTGGMRQVAKLMLNALYGKFGTNPHKSNKNPSLVGDVIKYEKGEERTEKPIYTALSCFVTSYGRARIIREAGKSGDSFLYSDTDSIHSSKKNESYSVSRRLGDFKIESRFVRARYVKAKEYIEEDEKGNIIVKASGMGDGAKMGVTFDNFKEGHEFRGNLRAQVVKGGTILKEGIYTLK